MINNNSVLFLLIKYYIEDAISILRDPSTGESVDIAFLFGFSSGNLVVKLNKNKNNS
jgi:hypothetical protein